VQRDVKGVEVRLVEAAVLLLQSDRALDRQGVRQQRDMTALDLLLAHGAAAAALVGRGGRFSRAPRPGDVKDRPDNLLRLGRTARDVRDHAVAHLLALRHQAANHLDRDLHQQRDRADQRDFPNQAALHPILQDMSCLPKPAGAHGPCPDPPFQAPGARRRGS
jgi:hypothetical protein